MPKPRPLRTKSPADVHFEGKKTARRQRVRWSASVTPLSFSGLVSWYDFSDISTLWQDTGQTSRVTADGQAIARVTDKSVSAIHLDQGTAGNRPTYKVNIQNGLSAAEATNAGNTFMRATAAPLTGDATIISAFKSINSNNQGVTAWGQRQAASGTPIRAQLTAFGNGTTTVGKAYFRDDANNLTQATGTSDFATSWMLLVATYSSTTQTLYEKTVQVDQATNSGGATTTDIVCAFDYDGSVTTDGYIGEVAVWSRALATSELSAIVGYFATKWAI